MSIIVKLLFQHVHVTFKIYGCSAASPASSVFLVVCVIYDVTVIVVLEVGLIDYHDVYELSLQQFLEFFSFRNETTLHERIPSNLSRVLQLSLVPFVALSILPSFRLFIL